jgi:hypothetical protein
MDINVVTSGLKGYYINMPFCPKCRDEFQRWVKQCPDCGLELVDRIPPEFLEKSLPVRLVTVADYIFSPLAYLSQAKLESEGIRSFVFDEHIINADWLYLIAIGGVKLKVGEADAEKAIRILKEVRDSVPGTSEQPGEGCPRCLSSFIHYETFHVRRTYIVMAISVLFGTQFAIFIPIFIKKKWKCNSCGYEWKNKS